MESLSCREMGELKINSFSCDDDGDGFMSPTGEKDRL